MARALLFPAPLLSLLLLLAGPPPRASAEDDVTLRLRFASGERYEIEFVERRRLTTTTRPIEGVGAGEGGRSEETLETRTIRVTFLLTIGSVEETGTAHASLKILALSLEDRGTTDGISLRAAANEGGKPRVEAHVGKHAQRDLVAFLHTLGRDLLDLVVEIDVSPRGEILGTDFRGPLHRDPPEGDAALRSAAAALQLTLGLEDLVRAWPRHLFPQLPVPPVRTKDGVARTEETLPTDVDPADIADRSRRMGHILFAPYGRPGTFELTFLEPEDVVLTRRATVDVQKEQVLEVLQPPAALRLEGRLTLALLGVTLEADIEVEVEWERRARWTRR